DLCLKAEALCEKHNFRYWETALDINRIKVQLLDAKISLRPILRKLLGLLKYLKDNRLYLLEIDAYEILFQIYAYLKIEGEALKYFELYKEKIALAAVGLPEFDIALFYKKRKYFITDFHEIQTVTIKNRMNLDSEKWQDDLFDILKLHELSRMKFLIDKTIVNLFSPSSYVIILKNEMEKETEPFINNNFSIDKLHSPRYLKYMSDSIGKNEILQHKIDHNHVLFVPLRIKTEEVGCLILSDSGEIPFQQEEKNILKILRLHLTSILLRINEFASLNNDMELMSKLITITQNFFSILNVNRLEQEVVSVAVDFTGGTRGFLIKKDKYENYVYKVALDDSKHLLKSYAYISKTILMEVQQIKQPIYIENVLNSKLFESYLDHTENPFFVYCAPILVDGEIYGYLYIDSFNSENEKKKINSEFMKLLLIQISVAFKNAIQYENLMFKNQEISNLENIKKDFINIASHELNTPLSAVQGYVTNLLRNHKHEEDTHAIEKINDGVLKMRSIISDLLGFNKYQLTGKLEKHEMEIKPILGSIMDDKSKLSENRHMHFRLEVEDNLPPVPIDLEAFQLMMHHIIINAIRFTRDFGTITIGARHSTFQPEEINGKESVVLFVQDNGIGIPENQLEKVYQKFYELGDLISHKSGFIEFKSGGLGLGLAIVKLIVELHNGKTWINSKENEGTTVFVALPVRELGEK
ncbi:MAG TPA: GAF domain-containing sensor histidine kinase, partial [Candidatus Cloacimonadota bacterium]|nr:GAF domain-containing sensor histidine kinase [Candidatus Cloacimonadota bacterium]